MRKSALAWLRKAKPYRTAVILSLTVMLSDVLTSLLAEHLIRTVENYVHSSTAATPSSAADSKTSKEVT